VSDDIQATPQTQMGRPLLAGTRVLDFTHVLAGPFCTRLLADLGSDVLKVESATRPERMGSRKASSNAVPMGRPDRAPSFLNTNRSKRSITINLKTDTGRNLARRLASVADIVVENFSAGVMDRLELGYGQLQPLNSKLIYVSMSGYGHDGPRKSWTSMNMNLQAYTGLMMVTGAQEDPPTAIANSWNDYIGGLHACFGILEALTERTKSGLGTNIDLSQFECSVSTFGPLLLSSIVNQTVPPRLGSRSMVVAPQGVYRCAGSDEWCAISIQNDHQWRAFIVAMGNPAWARESRFSTLQGRQDAHDELDQLIESWTSHLSKIEVEGCLKKAGVSAERMRRIPEVLENPDRAQVFHPWDDPQGGSKLTTGDPFTFSSSLLAPLRPAPMLGEHTKDALGDWLGLSENEIRELKEQGALT
jgi:crotonobetainyl-CoA:carnitine CoA-transferase CaiB-like acyl-CoA transferase